MRGINRELFPLMRMTYPRDFATLDARRIALGRRAFRSWVLLLGVLPVDCDDLIFDVLEPCHFLERSGMQSQREWEHERRVVPTEGGSILTDRLCFAPRATWLGPLYVGAFRLVFWLRHRNLRRLFGGAEIEQPSGCTSERA